ncbi:hypothetical protein [Bacillus cereus]|uniref:hypothetical protein n=1 Tax=Bacillus cereus TaxID=1396 RepID=UPI00294E7AD4|nr:hypothetical protein [Bacillus cereus]MDV6364584.1 hypothetical protein [Bacillus cereus]
MAEPNSGWLRWTHRHCWMSGKNTGFPTFIINNKTYFQTWIICSLENDAIVRQSRTAIELQNVDPENVRASIRMANLYARDNTNFNLEDLYRGGFPTFEKWMDGGREVRELAFVKREAADFERIHISTLESLGYNRNILSDTEAQFRALHHYATEHNYISGMPTFTEEGEFIGVLLFKQGFANIEEIPFIYYNIQDYNYDHLTSDRIPETVQAFEIAANGFENCSHLSDEEKRHLANAFGERKFILDMPQEMRDQAAPGTIRRARAEWDNHDVRIFINWDAFLDPNTGNVAEIRFLAEVLIHEMMHIALRKDHDIQYDPSFESQNFGCGDPNNHPYFQDPMLRAQCCIRNELHITGGS